MFLFAFVSLEWKLHKSNIRSLMKISSRKVKLNKGEVREELIADAGGWYRGMEKWKESFRWEKVLASGA